MLNWCRVLLVVHSLGFSFFKGLFGVSLTLSPCDCQLKPSKPLLKNLVGNFSTMFNIRKWHLSCGQFSGSSLGLETKLTHNSSARTSGKSRKLIGYVWFRERKMWNEFENLYKKHLLKWNWNTAKAGMNINFPNRLSADDSFLCTLCRAILGSVSNYVVNNGSCPITVVKNAEESGKWRLVSSEWTLEISGMVFDWMKWISMDPVEWVIVK